jgi:hypothetical protein
MTTQIQSWPITREQALEIAKRAEEILKTRFGATRVIVFGYNLKWELMLPHSEAMAENLALLRAQLDQFFSALEQMKHDEQ